MAVVFLFTGLLCIGEFLPMICYQFGFERDRGLLFQAGGLWVIVGGLVLFWAICYGVVALIRSRRSVQYVFLAMTLFLTFRFLTEPDHSFRYSQGEILVRRALLLAPIILSCVYLFRVHLIRKRQG